MSRGDDGRRARTIGPYQVEARLGGGGMGEVYLAYDERLDRQVAVKLIRGEAADDERARERFRREARTAASLSHPSIVQIHDLVTTADGDALVMELVTGVTLARLLAAGPLPLERLLRLGQQVAEGLAAAHARGIVHRDLKAENVMVTDSGHAKILDFGVAKWLRRPEDERSLSVAGAVVGTYSSMSPEQARGLAVDHRSDLFSFGALLYEMATGRPPFLAATVLDTLTNVCGARQLDARALQPELPAALAETIDRLLEKDPARRPQSADEVVLNLARIAAATAASPAASETGFGAAPRRAFDRAVDPAIDQPTVVVGAGLPVLGAPVFSAEPAEPSPASPSPSQAPAPDLPRRRRRRLLLAGGVVAAVAALAAGVIYLLPGGAPPLVVAVPAPALGPRTVPSADTDLMAAGLRASLLQTLLALQGVSPLAPEQVDPVAGAPLALARSVAADEVVAARLDCSAASCRVGLSRIAGKDGRLLWTASFEAPTGEPFLLAGEVASHLRQGFPERRARPGAAALAVRPADYREYLRLRGASIAQSRPPGELLPPLAALEESSPRFVESFVLEAGLRRLRFTQGRDPEDLTRAFEALGRARRIAPADPRPLVALFDLALTGARLDRAEAALGELERLEPGDPATLVLRARLLERRGASQEALATMRRAVARRPSWANLDHLAIMEYGLGETDAARRDVRELLRRSPGLYAGETLLAQIELLAGDPATAAALYSRLVARSPHAGDLGNLGLAYLLLRRYPEAAARFRQARDLEPANLFNVLNLADATLLEGDRTAAEALYRRVLALAVPDPAAAAWQLQSARAQAFAHLGRRREAVDAAEEVLRLAPANAQAAEEAALVYTLVGDQSSAVANADRALARGVEPVWLTLPWFDPLRPLPDFQESLRRHARKPRA